MKAFKITSLVIDSVLTITACKKKTSETPIDGTSNPSALANFFSANMNSRIQHFSVNASTGGFITGTQGTSVIIYGNTLQNSSGSTITGMVDVELVEVYDRASMVLLNKPTVGILPNGDHSTLISKGEYYLKITQNGNPVTINNGVIVQVPANNIPGQNFGMALFDGITENGNFLWDQIQDSIPAQQGDSTFTSTYQILEGSWGWTNVDRFYNDPRPKTTLKVKLPNGFDNTNSEVYITYDGEPGALASLDTYTSDGCFSEHYGLIPIGLEIHIIAVTLINGELNYAIQAATVVNGQIETINSFTPITQSQLAALINALP
jgi:hypothetical protein